LSSAERTIVAATGHALLAAIEYALEQASTRATFDRLEPLFRAASAELPDPPEAMVGFLERAFEPIDGVDERRQDDRGSLLATLVAIPLSDSFEPCDEPFKAAARDASAGGLSLLHTRAVAADYLALCWPSLASPPRNIQVVLRVNRRRPMGPFFEVAGTFLTPGTVSAS
jgi:hypothetical protein